jgi:hypothetical protein
VTCPFVWEAADVEERPLDRAWRAALDERPWEPAEGWDEYLRRRRQWLAGLVALLPIAGLPYAILVEGLVDDDWASAGLWGSLTLLYTGLAARPFWSTSARVEWDDAVRERVLLRHALKHHTSVGLHYRAKVTERAERIRANFSAGLVGWPLLAVVCLAVILDADTIGLRLVAGIWAVLAVSALVDTVRRARWAKRWLADPLPRS